MLYQKVNEYFLFEWWVDGLVSSGVASIDFSDKKNIEKFQKIYEVIDKEIKVVENKNIHKLCDKNWYYSLINLQLFFGRDNLEGYSSLESVLIDLSFVGKTDFSCIQGNRKIRFIYSQSYAESNFREVPDKYKNFIERISKVMID